MKKLISIVIIAIIAIGGYFGYRFYSKYYGSNVSKEGFVLIPQNADFKKVIDSIRPYLSNVDNFESVAKDKNLAENIKAGRYEIKSGTNNSNLVNMIKAGNQTPDNFRIKDFDDVYQMIGRVTRKTELDSARFVKDFDAIAQEKAYKNAEDLKKYFFNDTYQFFWTVTPKEFFEKFNKDYQEFWNNNRIAKEKQSGLSRDQIYALASIVYKESGGKKDEQKTIAGLYLNRYKKGMKLQSDPTVIYAINKTSNFTKQIKRVYYKDLKAPSPYNTYANAGIPPGPICVVDKNSIDAVLDADHNNYIYMCADPARLGYHKFTDNDVEHAKNAKAYQDWLNAKQIK